MICGLNLKGFRLSRFKEGRRVAMILTDEEGCVCDLCADCSESYVEDIWWEWCCDAKKCIHPKEYEREKQRLEEGEEDDD